MEGHTQGLCGTFDHNQNNDFLTPQGIIETNPNRFGNSWNTSTATPCIPVPDVTPPNACDVNPQRLVEAQQACAKLRSVIFQREWRFEVLLNID